MANEAAKKAAAAAERGENYLVLEDKTAEGLAKKVTEARGEGWQLWGGVAIGASKFAQAMIRN